MISPLSMIAATPASLHAIRLGPFDPAALPVLQRLCESLVATAPDLHAELTSAARGQGAQVAIAWRGAQPVGCAGWVTFGIAHNGQCFGSPVVVADAQAADTLICHLIEQARSLGARSLRISAWAGEDIKRAALLRAGFTCYLQWVHFALPVHAIAQAGPPLVDGLRQVDWPAIDWPAALALYADTFRHVPNAPEPDLDDFMAEWADTDRAASAIFADETGRYRAFIQVSQAGKVDSVGVDDSLRGRGVAGALYSHAARHLAVRGVTVLRALVASTNAQSMALHGKLGFAEEKPRGEAYELML